MRSRKEIKRKVALPCEVDLFYKRIADCAGYPLEKVLGDCLTKYAGELAERAIYRAERQ